MNGWVSCCSVANSCLTLCNPINCSTPGFPVLHYLPELAQTHVHWVSDAFQSSHPLSSPSPPAFRLFQHKGLSSELALRIRWPKYWSISFSMSFQWTFRVDLIIHWVRIKWLTQSSKERGWMTIAVCSMKMLRETLAETTHPGQATQ